MTSRQFRGHLLSAVHQILRSLTRTLLRAGIRFGDFAAVARDVYIESAIRDFRYQSTPSRQRIAVITGLTRAQVDAYVDERSDRADSDPELMFLVAEVLRAWHTNPQFLGPYGIPLELRFDQPENRSFRSMVKCVDAEADAHVVLAELLRTGVVVRSGEQHFRVVSRSVMLTEGISSQRIEYHTNGLARLAATLEYNMDPKHTDKRLDRRVHADRGLPMELVPAFESYARDKVGDFLLELDNWLALHTKDDMEYGERVDAGVTAFAYLTPIADKHSGTSPGES